MSGATQPSSEHTDDILCGLTVYSSELLPLGRVSDVPPREEPAVATINDRSVRIEPIAAVRHVLDGVDLLVSESMIYSVQPAEDCIILNLPARRVLHASPPLHEQLPTVANTHQTCQTI